MAILSLVFNLAAGILLILFFGYTIFYYRQAKKYSLETGLTMPLWIKGIFVLIFTFLITLFIVLIAQMIIQY